MAQQKTRNELGEIGSSARRADRINLHVGARVRLRRTLLGMSQEELGKHLGLTFQQIQKYEKGINRISASRLYRIAQVLGPSVQYFFDGAADPQRRAEEPTLTFLYSREALQLSDAFARIRAPEARQAIVQFVHSLANDESALREVVPADSS